MTLVLTPSLFILLRCRLYQFEFGRRFCLSKVKAVDKRTAKIIFSFRTVSFKINVAIKSAIRQKIDR